MGSLVHGLIWLLNHAFCAAVARTSGDEDTVSSADFVPCFVVFSGLFGHGWLFEVGGIDPDEV